MTVGRIFSSGQFNDLAAVDDREYWLVGTQVWQVPDLGRPEDHDELDLALLR